MKEVSITNASPISEATIEAIWRVHQLGHVTSITRPSGGIRNPCFFVNDIFVVRFNTQDRGSTKFRSERIAYTLLTQQSLPVPQVLLLDESHTLIPYDFIILSRLPGDTLADSWHALSHTQLHTLIFTAGQYLARIHSFTFSAFGKLFMPTYTTWPDYVRDYVERYLQPATMLGLVDEGMYKRIKRAFDRTLYASANVSRPTLVHCDFHYENILQRNGYISGLLDFEWALAGDSSYDFMIHDVRERMIPNSEEVFTAGYQSIQSFTPGHQERIDWYRLFMQLEDAVIYQRDEDIQNASRAIQSLERLLDSTT